MGTIILCAGNKNPNITKYCYPFSFGLFHSGETIVGGESTSVDDIIDFNRSINNAVKDYVVQNTNISSEEYEKHHRKQWYLTAKEMKQLGLIDVIIGEQE